MKKIILITAVIVFAGCSSVRLVDSWRNNTYVGEIPGKVLVVGITDNLTGRKIYEEHLKNELQARGIDAVESYQVFSPSFMYSRQSEETIQEEVDKFADSGYDAILVSVVKGVSEEVSYSRGYARTDYFWRRFGGYYFVYQDIYFDPGYYDRYNIYHIEASLYDIRVPDSKSLVWVASFDLVEPGSINRTVKDYVKRITEELEKEKIIPAKQETGKP
ncbi:hypothetical protein ED312_21390 [Sinomicrobium pectinilyticum]|uniref:DUF4136 domain-containing protein n=1 Tax=Sinomicrobium pectinilyticum TaxID=1084421 RepID=A0A3N0DHZ1_SINP1|nr:hypothetical protein [Sinomicrobium pectinilyticum]RNL75298.1 hypothetical protein ED312_21390 [Sinomicrobium pectinilyticum]